MKEQDIIFKVIDILETNFSDFDVQTEGGGGDASLPAINVSWSSQRRPDIGGHDILSGYTRDSGGNVTQVHLNHYYQIEIDFEVQSYDEGLRDNTLNDIQAKFIEYEWKPDDFHQDTFEWVVGEVSPRNNPVIEPDWYEAGLVVTFNFVKEVVKDADGMEAITESVENVEENLDSDASIII